VASSLDFDSVSIQDLSITRMNGSPGGLSGANADLLQAVKKNTGPGGTLASSINAGIKQIVDELRSSHEDLKKIAIHTPVVTSGGNEASIIDERLRGPLEKLEETLLAFSDHIEEHGKVVSEGLYSNSLKLKEYEFLNKSVGSSIDAYFNVKRDEITSFGELIRVGQATSAKNFFNTLQQAALGLTDLGAAFRSAKQSFTAEGGTFMKDIFGSNILSPGEFFLNGWNLLARGLFGSTDNLITTLGLVKEKLDTDLASPLTQTGQSLVEYAQSLHKVRSDIFASPAGEGIRRFGIDTTTLSRIAEDTLDTLHRQGVREQITQSIAEDYTINQIKILQDIASHTGAALPALEKLFKQNSDVNSRLVVMGQLTAPQAQAFTGYETQIQKEYGTENTKDLLQLHYDMLKANNDVNQFRAMNTEWANPFLTPILEAVQRSNQILLNGGSREQAEAIDRSIKTQIPSMTGLQQKAVFSEVGVDKLGNILMGLSQIQSRMAPTEAQNAVIQGNDLNTSIGKLQNLWTNTISPLFGGFAGAAAHLVFSMGVLAVTMSTSVNGMALLLGRGAGAGLASGVGAGIGGLASGIGRLIPGVAGAGIAYEMGGGISGAAGAGIGTVVGGAIGTALDGFIGPLGTTLGMVAGGYFGEKLGEYIGGVQPPEPTMATPSIQNPVGPDNASIADVNPQVVSWQDNVSSLLTQVVGLLGDGNSINNQILSENMRQSGYMVNGIGGSPVNIPSVGQGLSGGAGLPSKSSRPDMSYSYGSGNPS
jgi:hypothetical protein